MNIDNLSDEDGKVKDIIRQDVTDAELNVLNELWDSGGNTLRQLAESLYPQKQLISAQATVQKLLERLETKQYVRRQKVDGPQVFRALVQRDELIGLRLQTVANQLCDGAWTPLLTTLVKTGTLSPKDRQELQSLLDQVTGTGNRK